MGTSRLGEASLCALPEDVHLQILDLLPPAQIAVFAELCTATRAAAHSPSVWASVARRHLAVVPPARATPASVAALARTLVCRWWLATGLLVPGVAVHRRSGFLAVRTRGGTEVSLSPDGSDTDTAYVFAGRNAHRCTPSSAPAVELDFALDPAGPFPVDGLTIRLQHAAELSPEAAARLASSTAPADKVSRADDDDDACASAAPGPYDDDVQAPARAHTARVRVELNNVVLSEAFVDASHKFSTMLVHVPASALAVKPASNMLAVRYDRGSTAGYWLRDVTVCPAVLPLPRVGEAIVPTASVAERDADADAHADIQTDPVFSAWIDAMSGSSRSASPATSPPPPHPRQRVRERVSSPRDAPSSPRRGRRRDADGASASPRAAHGLAAVGAGGVFAEAERGGARAVKGKTPGTKARTPKHKYHQHQHHHRSPRSPRTRGAR